VEEEEEEEEEIVVEKQKKEEVEKQKKEEVEKEEEEEEDEEEDSEVFEITISGKKYYTNNEVNGKIYSIEKDEEVGDEIGMFVNSVPKFNK
jgi:hypothetical protein